MVSKSGLLRGKDEYDWKWWHQTVPSKLSNIHQEGYTVVIVSNQGRLTLHGEELAEAKSFKVKMESVMRALGVPVAVMVAGDNDLCRKPRTGLWSLLGGPLGNTKIDKSQSFVVGDAAGREKDFLDNDRHIGMNLQIGVFTPKEFFRGEPAKDLDHKFDPGWYLLEGEGNKGIT
jgi:bifunctional polynucleotide phosphatase/kinase